MVKWVYFAGTVFKIRIFWGFNDLCTGESLGGGAAISASMFCLSHVRGFAEKNYLYQHRLIQAISTIYSAIREFVQ